ncbi:hypothetical protein KL86SPO_50393 [uncultured Sporomusa sp.]|uniref:Uncharacterized protein n=1 Tax=uncultured Sporomusa sp. TaxID=307249 RepID=A0A212LYK2_9FIRM|nr:hypothetical protein KL86SPO_50393 [uncultured Sporomusa sp.]
MQVRLRHYSGGGELLNRLLKWRVDSRLNNCKKFTYQVIRNLVNSLYYIGNMGFFIV